MMIGHLAPLGPVAVVVEHRWRPEWPRWTRALPWIASLVGCVFPDLDIIANILLNGTPLHLYFLPHSILPYLPVLALGWALSRRHRTRLVGLTILTFCAGVFSHLVLDAISHGTVLFYPLWYGLVGWTYPHTGEHFLIAYIRSPNFWLEPAVLILAGGWWLNRYARRQRKRLVRRKRVAVGYLSALPRHEGSRLLQPGKPVWSARNVSMGRTPRTHRF
jgi:hypothetical protein